METFAVAYIVALASLLLLVVVATRRYLTSGRPAWAHDLSDDAVGREVDEEIGYLVESAVERVLTARLAGVMLTMDGLERSIQSLRVADEGVSSPTMRKHGWSQSALLYPSLVDLPRPGVFNFEQSPAESMHDASQSVNQLFRTINRVHVYIDDPAVGQPEDPAEWAADGLSRLEGYANQAGR